MTIQNNQLISPYLSKFDINEITNIYEDPIFVEFYDEITNAEAFFNDIQFYKDNISKNSLTVEFAAGTGRVTIPLLDSGYKVIGIEKEYEMIKKIPEEYRLNFIQENIFNFEELNSIYKELDTIIIPATSISLFSMEQINTLIVNLTKLNSHFNIMFDLINYKKVISQYPKKEITSEGTFYYYNFLSEEHLIYNLLHKDRKVLGYSVKYHHNITDLVQLFENSGLKIEVKEVSNLYFMIMGSYEK